MAADPHAGGAVTLTDHSALPQDSAEVDRLAELRGLRILDTAAEERFDILTRFAVDVLDVPIALVSLVDDRRQWFKSAIGLDKREMPREISFCGHAIHEPEMLVVPDAMLDSRFRDNPLVTGPLQFRAYAGAVLRGPSGNALGTLCVIDRNRRDFSAVELAKLRSLGRLVEWELAQDRLIDELLHEAERRAFYHAPTDLPNRHLGLSRLDHMLRTGTGSHAVVLFLDLDEFDALRRVAGGVVSEALLHDLAVRLKQLDADVQVAFWRKDKFMLSRVVDDAVKGRDRFLAQVRQIFERRFTVVDREYDLTASVGVSMAPLDGADSGTLIRNARVAVPVAGRGDDVLTVGFFTPDIDARLVRRFEIAQRLKQAVMQNELQVMYQPIVDAKTYQVRSLEALARWNDPRLREITPGEFIPLAEESYLIVELGEYVIERVLQQQRAWREAGVAPLRVAVNLSPRQLRQPDFSRKLAARLTAHGLEGKCLQLEITEYAVLENNAIANSNLIELSRLGITLALDDFGAGYSSFGPVRRLPVSVLKIDREFVEGITDSPRDADIVHAIVTMAHAIGLDVVVEGVETAEQARLLRDLGCEELQGFLFSRAVPGDQLPALLQHHLGPAVLGS